MKVPAILKISFALLGLGGMLVLTPSARAQSDVSPDHFDGTDPWEIALARESARKTAKHKPVALQVQKSNTRQGNAAPQAQPAALVTVQKRRRTAEPKPEKQ